MAAYPVYAASITHSDNSTSNEFWKVTVGIDQDCTVTYYPHASNSVSSNCYMANSTRSSRDMEVLISKQSYEVIPISLSNHAYLTTPHSPLLSAEECQQIIALAEAYTRDSAQGWSTKRHYAVPTTDFPVHHCAPILEWFNGAMKDRIIPLISAQLASGQ